MDLSLGEYVQEMGSIPEPQARAMFKGVLDCVCFLHRKGLAHRGRKVENLMFVPTEALFFFYKLHLVFRILLLVKILGLKGPRHEF